MALECFVGAPAIWVASFEALVDVIDGTGLPRPLSDIVAATRPSLVVIDGPAGPISWIPDVWVAFHESRRGDPAIEATVDSISASFDRIEP